MVEINNKTDVQYVYYPKTQNSTGPYTLHIHSELSQKDWHFENVEDKASLHDYYKFLVDYSSVDDGEFNYQIISNEEVMDTGLLRIGIGQASVRGYDTPNEIIQYDMYGEPTERYQHKSISATSNGTYNVLPDDGYAALSEVDIYVNVPCESGASYESGYTDGFSDGFDAGYTSGSTDGYTSGKTDGAAEQKAKLVATAITANGTYSRPDGYSSVSVNVAQTGHTDAEMAEAYASGKTDGAAEQKAKLVATAVTQNGTYSRPDGYSSISVNVPQTGASNADLIANLQGDYFLIPEGTTHLRDYAFNKTCFSSITIPSSVSAIGDYALANNSCLTGITIPDSVVSFGNFAFASDFSLGSLAIPDSVTGMGTWCFYNCSGMTSVTLGSGLTYLSDYAFDNCGGLTGITIHSGITSIGDKCFLGANALQHITFESLVPPTLQGERALNNTGRTFPIYVPCVAVEDYKTAWPDYAHRITCIPDPTTAATAITINVPSAITGSGQATVTVNPSTAIVDLNFTSSDDTIATIDSGGNITVISAGTVNICVTDRNSGLYDCETVTVTPASGLGAPLTVDVLSAGTILWVANPSETPLSIEYKVNDGAWTSITATTAGTPINVAAGDEVQFRGDNVRYCTQRYGSEPELTFGNHINMSTGKYAVRGNIMSMISSTNYDSLTTFESTSIYAFLGFFANSLGLVDASGLLLPATTLCTECYYAMFAGCTNLVSAPALPATVLAYGCYLQMFANCTSLAQAPSLPATTLESYCYSSMFHGCTSLVVAPVIAATTVADNCCLYMFNGCTSLTQAPALLATTMAGSCYQRMFYGCTSLTTAPALPATTLANMCYKEMFYNCSALTQAPSLPASALTDSCYNGMFYNCRTLTTAPELPAAILAPSCYAWMFYGANSLNYIKCMGITFGSNATTGWAQNVASSGTFVKDPNATWGRGVNGIPTNWTVEDAQ